MWNNPHFEGPDWDPRWAFEHDQDTDTGFDPDQDWNTL